MASNQSRVSASIIGEDLDTRILVRAHRLVAVSSFAALEQVHVEPQTEQVQPGLGGLAALETAFDEEIRAQDTVDGFGSTAGAHNAFQDVEQGFSQLKSQGIVSHQFSHESRGEFGFGTKGFVSIGDCPVQTPGPRHRGLEELALRFILDNVVPVGVARDEV